MYQKERLTLKLTLLRPLKICILSLSEGKILINMVSFLLKIRFLDLALVAFSIGKRHTMSLQA
jgi:hypothetical protein